MTAAKKDTSKSEVKPAVTPEAQPQPPTPATPVAPAVVAPVAATPSKQQTTLETLKQAWTARKVDLSKMTTKMDGKFLIVLVGEGWPEIRIGVGGGIDLPAIKSYPKAFDAAVNGDQLLKKQADRLAKATAPAPATTTKPAVQTSEKKAAETVTAKKAKADAELESKLEQRA